MAYGHIKWVSELSKPWKLSPREQYQVQIKYWLWDRRGKVIPWTLSCKSFSVLLSNVYSLNYILRCNKIPAKGDRLHLWQVALCVLHHLDGQRGREEEKIWWSFFFQHIYEWHLPVILTASSRILHSRTAGRRSTLHDQLHIWSLENHLWRRSLGYVMHEIFHYYKFVLRCICPWTCIIYLCLGTSSFCL